VNWREHSRGLAIVSMPEVLTIIESIHTYQVSVILIVMLDIAHLIDPAATLVT
jgi:hypothetical protein